MKEVKSPKKPLLYYYSIVLIVILLVRPTGFLGKKRREKV